MGSFEATLLTAVFGLLTSIVIARAFGPDGKGLVTLVLLVLSQIVLFLSLGVNISLVHYAGRKQWHTSRLAGAGMGLALVLGAAALPITLFVFVFILGEGVPDQVFPALMLLALSVPISLACGRT